MATTAEVSPPMNHVFVDYENVPEVDASLIGSKAVNFTLMLGANQKKLDVAVVEKLIQHSASTQMVRLTTGGKNAVDFALAYYLGRAVLSDPTAYFHLISKDKGYDPLIEHLRSRHVHVRRHDDFSTLTFGPLPKASPQTPATPVPLAKDDLFERALEHLRKHRNNRPRRQKTLTSHLLAFAGKTGTTAAVASLIEKLKKAGHLCVDDKGAVTYRV